MKPNRQSSAWTRLLETALKAPAEKHDDQAPFGFSTRVVAKAFSVPRTSLASVFERLSWRALGLSCALSLFCLASSYSYLASAISSSDEESELQDPVAEVIEFDS
jgi:hypothetical protein